MSWVRSGECCKCGDCCIGSPPGESDPINGMCPLLISGPDETRVCSVHNSNHHYWNSACRTWPDDPHQIKNYPRCTFSFTWID